MFPRAPVQPPGPRVCSSLLPQSAPFLISMLFGSSVSCSWLTNRVGTVARGKTSSGNRMHRDAELASRRGAFSLGSLSCGTHRGCYISRLPSHPTPADTIRLHFKSPAPAELESAANRPGLGKPWLQRNHIRSKTLARKLP